MLVNADEVYPESQLEHPPAKVYPEYPVPQLIHPFSLQLRQFVKALGQHLLVNVDEVYPESQLGHPPAKVYPEYPIGQLVHPV